MVAAMRSKTYNQGVADARHSIVRYIWKVGSVYGTGSDAFVALMAVSDWIKLKAKRCNQRKGGIGRR